jgi:UDP-N-acetylmuramyl pentapeptide synthase
MPLSARFGVFEIGMNHAGEIEPLARMVRPHAAIVTTVEAVHLAHFASVEEIARAKAEIFVGLAKDGSAIINRDNPHYDLLAALARDAGVGQVLGFGEHPDAAIRLETVKLKEHCSCVSARILDEPISYKVGAPGRHLVGNSLAVLGAVAVLGGDLAKGALALATLAPLKGRGDRHVLAVGGDEATLIDESYNANPASMRAAIALLGETAPGRGGRRIAVLGDMRELGRGAAAMHADLLGPLRAADVDRVYLAGPLMRALWRDLPAAMRGGHCDTADELQAIVASAVAPGDVVMVKGSNASRMGPLVEALKVRFASARPGARPARAEDAA